MPLGNLLDATLTYEALQEALDTIGKVASFKTWLLFPPKYWENISD